MKKFIIITILTTSIFSVFMYLRSQNYENAISWAENKNFIIEYASKDWVDKSPTFIQKLFDYISDKKHVVELLGSDDYLIQDLSALGEFPKINVLEIYTKNNGLAEIQYLSNLEVLTLFNGSQAGFDLKGIENLLFLEKLDLKLHRSVPNLTSSGDLNSLVNLKVLDLKFQNIPFSFEDISNLTNLETISLVVKNISGFDSIKNLKNLKRLFISVSPNKDVINMNSIQNLKNVERLDFNGCNIANLNGFQNLDNLTHLSISTHSSFDVSKLSTNKNLTNLELRAKKIINIESLAKCKKIIELQLPKSITEQQLHELKQALPKCNILVR